MRQPPKEWVPNPMLDKEQTFEEMLAYEIENDKSGLILAILKNAKTGDGSAMKLILNAIEKGKYQKEDALKIAPEQFREIIKKAAERL